MKYKSQKQYRLPGFNYSSKGEYFVTICTHNRKDIFGKIKNGEIILNETGKIVKSEKVVQGTKVVQSPEFSVDLAFKLKPEE